MIIPRMIIPPMISEPVSNARTSPFCRLPPRSRARVDTRGWVSILSITILSLVPGNLRPHTPMPGSVDHFVIYLGCGGFLAFGYASLLQRLLGWFSLAIS